MAWNVLESYVYKENRFVDTFLNKFFLYLSEENPNIKRRTLPI